MPKSDRAVVPRPAPGREEITSLARKGLLDSAYGLAANALDSAPDDPFLLLMMGKLSPGGKESSEYFKKAIKTGGNSAEAEESLFRLGQFHYATGKYYLAIPFFRDYLRLFPKGDWKEPAAYWMGNACLSLAQGRTDRAAYLDSGAAWFQKLLDRTRPDDYYHPLALEGLAKAKAYKGDREGAWQAAKTALAIAPEEEQSPLLLLAAQLRQGVDRNDEKAFMAQLVGRYPQSPEARYLRKLNSGLDTAKWKSGSGLPRPASAAARDSLTPPLALPGTSTAAPDKKAPQPRDTAATVTSRLPTPVPLRRFGRPEIHVAGGCLFPGLERPGHDGQFDEGGCDAGIGRIQPRGQTHLPGAGRTVFHIRGGRGIRQVPPQAPSLPLPTRTHRPLRSGLISPQKLRPPRHPWIRRPCRGANGDGNACGVRPRLRYVLARRVPAYSHSTRGLPPLRS